MMLKQYKMHSWADHFSQKSTTEWIEDAKTALLPFIKKFIPKNAKIVEAGASFGRILKVLKDSGYTKVRGFDTDEKMIKKAKKELRMTIEKRDIRDTKYPPEYFDAWLDIGTLEHFTLDEQNKILHEARRVLKPKGKILCFVPRLDWQSPKWLSIFLIKNLWRRLNGAPVYQWYYTIKSLEKIFSENGFKLKKWCYNPAGDKIWALAEKDKI
ncbi:MAG: methyltransferase domain-containing protein [Candidatus Woesearchaeota archaeon]